MGSIGSRKLNRMLDNLEHILAIELLCSTQALSFRKPLKSSAILEACLALTRESIEFITEDRIFAEDIKAAAEIVVKGALVNTAHQAVVKNNIELDIPFMEEFSLY